MSRRIGGASLVTLAGALALTAVAAAARTVVFDGSPGTSSPPARLDGVKMTKFGRDHRAIDVYVNSVTGPTGQITFGEPGAHFRVRNTKKKGYWLTWSHHYRGDVYYFATVAKITLPARTTAFYLYAETNDGTYAVTARTPGATSGRVRVSNNAGARFFGFVAKGGAYLTTIAVTSTDRRKGKNHPGGFAIGEFGIHTG